MTQVFQWQHIATAQTTKQAGSGSWPNSAIHSGDLSFSICAMVRVWLESPGPSSSQPAPGRSLQGGVKGSRHFSTRRRTAPAQKKGWEAGGGVRIPGSLGWAVPARPASHHTSQAARAPRQDPGVWGTGQESEC